MPSEINLNNLTDVICIKCKRVIGQRRGGDFYQGGLKLKFNKTARITCHFVGCGAEQDFELNRQKPFKVVVTQTNYLIDNLDNKH